MISKTRRQIVVQSIAVAAVLVTGAAFAQGIGRFVPGVAPGHVVPPLAPLPGTQAQTPAQLSRQRLIAWFDKYDQIRHQAQMTPAERISAHKLMSKVLISDPVEKTAGRALLSKMLSRYVRASDQLKALPMLAQTADLQKGYEQYFATGRRVFEKYLQALDSKNPQDVMLSAQKDKYQMAVLNITNKVLDRKLRKQYAIVAFGDN